MRLRDYQVGAVNAVRAAIGEGHLRVLFVLPTGGGKTVIASHIIAGAIAHNSRVLFVAHRRELIVQAYKKVLGCTCALGFDHDARRDRACAADGIDVADVGIIMASDRRRRPRARVQIASIDTLRHRRPLPFEHDGRPVVIIVDEAHRTLAKSYLDLLEGYPGARVIGLTATPYRANGRGLGDVYEALIVGSTPKLLIEHGHIVAPRTWTVPPSDLPDLSKVRTRHGDYVESELAEAVDRAGLIGNIVEHWARRAEGRRTVAFAASVEHSKHIADQFVAAGVRAEHLDGTTAKDVRDAILARLDRGETQVVTNCGVLCEGWDQPAVKCAILARPTKSTGLYLQQAGRILRPWNDTTPIILDHAGCALEHGLPQDDREFSLETTPKRKKTTKDLSVKNCPQCFAVVASATHVCPECGHEFVAESPIPDEKPGELVEVTESTMAEKLEGWKQICELADLNGKWPGFERKEFKRRFGHAPPKSFPQIRKLTVEQRREEYERLVRIARERGYSPYWPLKVYESKFGEKPIFSESSTPAEKVKWAI